ncbi:hypothetical protein Tco_0812523 [Tanacetum coccineum]
MIESEPVKKLSKKYQLKLDEEVAKRLQTEFDEQKRIEREKAKANVALIEEWNDIQEKIEADQLLAERLVNTFVDIDTELVNESSKKADAEIAQESSSKRARDELEQENAKKQKIDDDKETTELQSQMEVILDEEEVAVDAIPLATKPSSILSLGIQGQRRTMRECYGGDLKTMFEPHVEDIVWRNLQGNKVLIWKLFDSRRVYFLRLQSMHIFMFVEKRYPLTPATITDMLNKKLQADHWNEMCYQLLKLITKQLKNQ